MDDDKDRIKDHIEYHIVHDKDENGENHEERRSEQESLTKYALIKYAAMFLTVLVVLYFIAIFVLPLVRDMLR